jgi:hypothetical protein
MRLPSNYREIVAAGVAVLRSVSADVRTAATARPHAPELWLVVRDHEGLAGRLADLDEREWRDGFAVMFITGQDIGVLDELLKSGGSLGASSVLSLTSQQMASLTRLREFLQRCRDRSCGADAPEQPER